MSTSLVIRVGVEFNATSDTI